MAVVEAAEEEADRTDVKKDGDVQVVSAAAKDGVRRPGASDPSNEVAVNTVATGECEAVDDGVGLVGSVGTAVVSAGTLKTVIKIDVVMLPNGDSELPPCEREWLCNDAGVTDEDWAETPLNSAEAVTVVTDGAEPVGSVVGGTMTEDNTLGNAGRLRLKSTAGLLAPGYGNPSLGRSVSRSRTSSGRG